LPAQTARFEALLIAAAFSRVVMDKSERPIEGFLALLLR
jgi:hypothetical protein